MTTKQLARAMWIGHQTLVHFVESGWVDPPATPDDWTPAEGYRASTQVRETIAQHNKERDEVKAQHEVDVLERLYSTGEFDEFEEEDETE